MELCGPGWRSGPLLVACTRRQRRRGLRPRSRGRGLLLAARSVHAWGMREPLLVVSVDGAGRVRRVRPLFPRRLFIDLGARWILELPVGRRLPPVGVILHPRRGFSPGSPSPFRPILDSCREL